MGDEDKEIEFKTVDFEYRTYSIGLSVTKDAIRDELPIMDRLPKVRLRDPWWRKPLVWLGVLEPRYRKATINDVFFGDDHG